MAIVPTDRPMTSELYLQTVTQLAEAYPFLRAEKLADTAFGRPIWALTLGTGPRKVIHAGAWHANEWLTATLLLKFAEDYAAAIESDTMIGDTLARQLSMEATMYIVPMVNPDGVDLVTGVLQPNDPQYEQALGFARNYPNIPFPEGWKANLNGVDLNLQFPAGWLQAREIKFMQGYTSPAPRDFVGRAPLSQAESRTMYDYTWRTDPDRVLAWHSQGEVIYYKFGGIEIPEAEALARRFSQVSGYALEDVPYSSSFAGYKDWFIQEFRRPGFTIEVGRGTNPLPLSQFDEIYRSSLGILTASGQG